MKPESTTATEYLFLHFPEIQKDALALMQKFLADNKVVEYYPFADKLAKQFAYADKK